MTTENKEVCNQCPNHCPITDLKCPRGRRALEGEVLEGGYEEFEGHGGHGMHGRHGDFEKHDAYDGGHGRGKHRGFGEHGGRCEERVRHGKYGECGAHRGHGGGRGGHGMHGENFDEDSLSGLMHGCAHFLHHCSRSCGGQEGILFILAEKESMSQKQLQELLRIQPGSLSEILTKLEHKGLVEKERDESDRRKSVIRLTESGKEAAKRAEKSTSRMGEEELFSVLTDEEQSELKILLKKLLDYWKDGR